LGQVLTLGLSFKLSPILRAGLTENSENLNSILKNAILGKNHEYPEGEFQKFFSLKLEYPKIRTSHDFYDGPGIGNFEPDVKITKILFRKNFEKLKIL